MMSTGFKNRIAKISFIVLFTGFLLSPVTGPVMDVDQADAAEIPEWVQSIKLKGDLRFRYQTEEENAAGDQRTRYRIRLRTGVSADVTDNWKVDFGLATGGTDLRSTNQTLEEFETGDIRLDYAYAAYKPSDAVNITFGKIKNPIWNPKDLIWDGDIMPDGAAATFNFKTSENLSWFVTPGYFVLGELREKKDDDDLESMALVQGGINATFAKNAYLKLAATGYMFNEIEPGNFAESAGTNTEMIENAFSTEAELGFKGAPIMVAVFGQYVSADADDENTGYLLGVKFGDKSVKALGDWQVKYNFRSLEANAFPDFLMDSDSMGGATGIEGSEIELALGITKNVTLNIDYYSMEEINGDGESNLLQFDVNLKF